jgi:alpha-1,3-glucan synthase
MQSKTLLSFRYPNSSAPFSLSEWGTEWKHPAYAPWGINEYQDFRINEGFNSSCQLPDFWLDTGDPIVVTQNGCSTSEFDSYGDMEAFGVHPDCKFLLRILNELSALILKRND